MTGNDQRTDQNQSPQLNFFSLPRVKCEKA